LSETPDFVESASGRRVTVSLEFEESVFILEDRKLSLAKRDTLFPNRQFVNGVIKRRAQIKQNVTNYRQPVIRDVPNGIIDKHLLSGIKIALIRDSIGFTIVEPLKFHLVHPSALWL
jgi:hypothetical protein